MFNNVNRIIGCQVMVFIGCRFCYALASFKAQAYFWPKFEIGLQKRKGTKIKLILIRLQMCKDQKLIILV